MAGAHLGTWWVMTLGCPLPWLVPTRLIWHQPPRCDLPVVSDAWQMQPCGKFTHGCRFHWLLSLNGAYGLLLVGVELSGRFRIFRWGIIV